MTHRELSAALTSALRSDDPGVPLKALVAAVVMVARGVSPTRLGMAKLGAFAYGGAQKNYRGLLTALVEQVPQLVAVMALDGLDPARAAQVRSALDSANRDKAKYRKEIAELKESLTHLTNYALALHLELDKVRGARPALAEVLLWPTTVPTPGTPNGADGPDLV